MNGNGFDTYQTSGYVNTRNRKKTLILDVDDSASADTHLGAGGDFNIDLFEPLIIDKHSEVYLDNFLTFNSNIAQTPSSSAFILKINEFNMNSNVASSSHNNNMFNSLIIPNEHKSVENNHSSIVHKGKKFNYICDINPQTIHSLSGTITDLSGSPIFHGSSLGAFFTYSLTGIDSALVAGLPINISLDASRSFTVITSNTAPQTVDGEFLASHAATTTSLHFSTADTITNITDFVSAAGNITFTRTGVDNIVITNDTAGQNASMILIQNPGRFIAEFSIISRE